MTNIFAFKTFKNIISSVSLAAFLCTCSAGLAPSVTEAAPPPRGGFHRVVQQRPGHGPAIRRPSVVRVNPGYRPGPKPGWQPGPRVTPGPRPWKPGPRVIPGTVPPPPRPIYRHKTRDRRIARGVAALGILAALLNR